MKKKSFCFAIVALIVLGLSSRGFCMANRPPASKKATSKQAAEPLQKISGKVSGYSLSNSTITIAAINGTLITIEIDKATKISKSEKLLKMADIKTNDVVTADYEVKGGKKIARAIIVQEKAAGKAAIPEKRKK